MFVRNYHPDDQVQCLEIFDSNTPKYFAPEEKPDFQTFLAEDAVGDYLVIEDHGRAAACGGFFFRNAETAALSWGMAANRVHGQGVGRLLLFSRLARIGAQAPNARVVLDTSQHTFPFFAKYGFSVQQVAADYYAPGLHRYDMELQLSPEKVQECQAAARGVPQVDILPMDAVHIKAAKFMIVSAAKDIFGWQDTVAERLAYFDAAGEFEDIDHYEAVYPGAGGLFLVVLAGAEVVGSVGIHPLPGREAGLKRMWLKPEYQGVGIGFHLMQRALRHAKRQGWSAVQLFTDQRQEKAIRFYTQLGFTPAAPAIKNDLDILLRLELEDM